MLDPADRARRRAGPLRRRRPAGAARSGSCAACAATSRSSSRIRTASLNPRMRVGSLVAEPLDDPPDRRDARRAAGARGPAPRGGGPRSGGVRQVPARVLGRPAAADRDRPRDRLRPALRRRRRAGVRARPVRPGPDRQPDGRPPGAARPGVPLHRARSPAGASTSPTAWPSCTWGRSSRRPRPQALYANPSTPTPGRSSRPRLVGSPRHPPRACSPESPLPPSRPRRGAASTPAAPSPSRPAPARSRSSSRSARTAGRVPPGRPVGGLDRARPRRCILLRRRLKPRPWVARNTRATMHADRAGAGSTSRTLIRTGGMT